MVKVYISDLKISPQTINWLERLLEDGRLTNATDVQEELEDVGQRNKVHAVGDKFINEQNNAPNRRGGDLVWGTAQLFL